MLFYLKNKKGFTLIELLVVVAIIGVLASVVLASLNSARAKGKDAARIQSIRQIRNAMELYYFDNGLYAAASGGVDGAGINVSALATPLSSYLKISSMTTDVTNNIQYVRGGSGQNYGLNVFLEKTGASCLIEVNVSGTNWWGLGTNFCNF